MMLTPRNASGCPTCPCVAKGDECSVCMSGDCEYTDADGKRFWDGHAPQPTSRAVIKARELSADRAAADAAVEERAAIGAKALERARRTDATNPWNVDYMWRCIHDLQSEVQRLRMIVEAPEKERIRRNAYDADGNYRLGAARDKGNA